jgi:hypothetical protein
LFHSALVTKLSKYSAARVMEPQGIKVSVYLPECQFVVILLPEGSAIATGFLGFPPSLISL